MRPLLLPLLVLPLLAGCNSEPYSVAPVSGRITLNGKALAKASVTFAPVADGGNQEPGPSSAGTTDSDGRYDLRLIGTDRRGAVVGKHKVRIALTDETNTADDMPSRLKQLPLKYNAQTRLEFEVPAKGSDQANFDLD
jgi:hypothetical protein